MRPSTLRPSGDINQRQTTIGPALQGAWPERPRNLARWGVRDRESDIRLLSPASQRIESQSERWVDVTDDRINVAAAKASARDDSALATWAAGFAAISGNYVVHNVAAVASFLQRYPDLIYLILEARGVIQSIFGECTASIASIPDPLLGRAERRILCVTIHPTSDVNDAIMAEQKFDQVWWLDAMVRSAGGLMFTVEF